MATIRLSVTIPSMLHERLEGMRDRVNVSRVCTVALEKELDMLEARPSVADPKIAQLVERLKGSTQRWYDHGHEDGARWAVEEAKRSELEDASYAFRKYDGRKLSSAYLDLPEYAKGGEGEEGEEGEEVTDTARVPELPGVGALEKREKRWVTRDLGMEEEPSWRDDKDKDARARFNAAYADVDDAAYLEGWRDALVELWSAVAPALR